MSHRSILKHELLLAAQWAPLLCDGKPGVGQPAKLSNKAKETLVKEVQGPVSVPALLLSGLYGN